ncbi:MAG: hypothetical protein AAF355_16170 [Myxococcota bacterium]
MSLLSVTPNDSVSGGFTNPGRSAKLLWTELVLASDAPEGDCGGSIIQGSNATDDAGKR